MTDEAIITVIATGLDANSQQQPAIKTVSVSNFQQAQPVQPQPVQPQQQVRPTLSTPVYSSTQRVQTVAPSFNAGAGRMESGIVEQTIKVPEFLQRKK